jgi:hypothetical protein
MILYFAYRAQCFFHFFDSTSNPVMLKMDAVFGGILFFAETLGLRQDISSTRRHDLIGVEKEREAHRQLVDVLGTLVLSASAQQCFYQTCGTENVTITMSDGRVVTHLVIVPKLQAHTWIR